MSAEDLVIETVRTYISTLSQTNRKEFDLRLQELIKQYEEIPF